MGREGFLFKVVEKKWRSGAISGEANFRRVRNSFQ
jgi:hypothetical protein